MPTLIERINNDIKAAMRAKDKVKLSTLRMTLAAAANVAIAERISLLELTNSDMISIIRKEIKKRDDTIEQCKKAPGSEFEEILILRSYLPPPMPEEELMSLVEATATELGATTRKDMGNVIKAVSAKAGGRVSGTTISEYVKGYLV